MEDNRMKHHKGKRRVSNKEFVKICKLSQKELRSYLISELAKYYDEVVKEDGFVYVKGNDKIALTAHMDTTPRVEYGKRKKVKEVYEYVEKGKTIVHSPQGIGGDDRCGVYMIMEILKRTELRPTIVFCEDEEIGCVGSSKFTKTDYIKDLSDMYFIIELDRRGNNDIVFYDDTNEDFHKYVAEVTKYVEEWGSCSDISYLCPDCGVAGVNISCGYYDEHHVYEKVVLEEMERTLNTTIKLIKDGLEKGVQYEYIEKVYGRWGIYDYNGTYRYDYGNSYWDDEYWSGKSTNSHIYGETYYLEVEFDNGYGDCGDDVFQGDSIADVWYQFFSSHPNLKMENVTNYMEWTEDEFKKAEG